MSFEISYLMDKLRVWMQGDGYRGVDTYAVQGYQPDLIGVNAAGRYANGEIKTPEKFKTERTMNKIKAFGTAKEKDGTLIPLYIAVPKGNEEAMRRLVEDVLADTSHVKVKGF